MEQKKEDCLVSCVDAGLGYENRAIIEHLDFSVHRGEYICVVGENGSGKSTLIRTLLGLLKPVSGKVELAPSLHGGAIGYLPQQFGYYKNQSPVQYLNYLAALKAVPKEGLKEKIKALLELVGLSETADKKMKKFSGGMIQRVGIAQALLNDPKILILDEPTAGLDPKERARFRNLISSLSRDRIVILSTHIVSDIEYIANQVLLMKDGKISHSGTQEEIIQSVPVKVWSCVVANNEVEMWQKQFKVSNMKTLSDGIELRILSEKCPHYNAKEETMTLEDIFLYYFGEKTGDDYDVL